MTTINSPGEECQKVCIKHKYWKATVFCSHHEAQLLQKRHNSNYSMDFIKNQGKGKGKRGFVQHLVVNTHLRRSGMARVLKEISQFYLHTPRSSANGMNHTWERDRLKITLLNNITETGRNESLKDHCQQQTTVLNGDYSQCGQPLQQGWLRAGKRINLRSMMSLAALQRMTSL